MGYLKIIAVTTAVVAVIVVAGCLHVVRGSRVHNWLGVEVCRKERWTLDTTLLNMNDYEGRPTRTLELDDDVIIALIRCGVVRIEPTADELATELEETGQTVSM
jgi:hypothetical protein